MCGIVAAISSKNVSDTLLNGLYQLEYRGYDSAGIAVINQGIHRVRKLGRVSELKAVLQQEPCTGNIGMAHTRWATHGVPDEINAHPHISKNRVVIAHNGIIENYESLKQQQTKAGFTLESETDSEVIAHQIMIHLEQSNDILQAVRDAMADLTGSYALSVIDSQNPDKIILARKGSPLIIGAGQDGNYAASDIQALLSVAEKFIYLENGDIACIERSKLTVFDHNLKPVKRQLHKLPVSQREIELGDFNHFMQKEINEQPRVVTDALEGRIIHDTISEEIIGADSTQLFKNLRAITIIACGTSYHAGLVARYWFEELAGIPCSVDIASEYRYRKQAPPAPGTLFITISQSGETADTLAALEIAQQQKYLDYLAICNVPESSIVRDSNRMMMTHAGPEIGVASTKAFTSQLVCLLLLAILAGRDRLSKEAMKDLIMQLRNLPARIEQALSKEPQIKELAKRYIDKQHTLFLGRGKHYPIAMEGALKMKEISYIHAEAYAAGELKHGPLALVDSDMPVVAVAPNDHLLEKLKSNLQEVRVRGGELHVFADSKTKFAEQDGITVIEIDAQENAVAPIIFTIPLQLLAYHTALLKGTDIDKPRNLAKSVTVE